jgi:hypothetical protein
MTRAAPRLASVDPVVSEGAPGDTLRRDSGAAVRARAIAVCERGDDEIALGDVSHLCAGLFHHADELVADRAHRVRRFPAVIPEIGAAHGPEHDADHGVGRCLDDGVGPVADLDAVRSAEERGAHAYISSIDGVATVSM